MTAEFKKTAEPVRIAEAMLQWINNHGAQGMITTDNQLRICSWNHWLEVHTGKKSETVLGKNLLEVFPELVERKLDAYYGRALEGQSGVLSHKLHRFLIAMPASELDEDETMHQSVRISPLVEDGNVIGTVTIIDDVTERVKREAELQRQLEQRAILLAGESVARSEAESARQRLQHLQAITDEALGHMALNDLLESSVKAIRAILGADTAAILLVDRNDDLVVRATDGISFDITGEKLQAGTGFAGMVARERRPMSIEPPFPPSTLLKVAEREGTRAVSGVPLLSDKRLLGVMSIGTRQDETTSEDDLRFMSLVGDRIAVAIERAQLFTAEKEARAQAEEANRLKDQFLATVSHELRTPLNAILGWARMLASGRIDERTSKHAVEVIERNAKAQAQLIDDLLDVSRIISGKLRLNICPVEPVSIVELALDSVSPAADAKEITLEAKLDKNIGTIPGDPDRIQQIIWNLLSNAIKFTPNGGRVTLEIRRERLYIEFSVTDSGQGISPDFLPYVFDRFRQADATVARAHGGLGLGLAIVRHLAELHGGTVQAASDGEGKGATFIVKLPIQSGNTTDGEQQQIDELPESHSPIALQGVRILVVDDDRDALDLMKAVLIECGAEVAIASSSGEGLVTLNSHRPHVLISDIEMPFEDGYTFIRSVRALSEISDRIFAVALTAHANAEDKKRALEAGFDLHVRKPVEPSELIAAINSLLENKNTESAGISPDDL